MELDGMPTGGFITVESADESLTRRLIGPLSKLLQGVQYPPISTMPTTEDPPSSAISALDKPLHQLTEDDISQLTREDCRRYLKQKGMRPPSWNKSQEIQQVIMLKVLLEPLVRHRTQTKVAGRCTLVLGRSRMRI